MTLIELNKFSLPIHGRIYKTAFLQNRLEDEVCKPAFIESETWIPYRENLCAQAPL